MGAMTEPTATHAGPSPTVTLVVAGDGTRIHPDDIAAQYVATDECWTDMPEAQPRARARVGKGRPGAPIVITKDGELHYDQSAGVEIDQYKHPRYAAVRAEGEARHAAA